MKRKVPKRFLNTLWPCRKPEKGRPNCYVGIDDENREIGRASCRERV